VKIKCQGTIIVCVGQNILSHVIALVCLLFRYVKVRCEVELSQYVP